MKNYGFISILITIMTLAIIKAAAGGGGKGMKVAVDEKKLKEAFRMARTESKAAFGDDTVYMEKYLQEPRHIEVQVLADHHGNVVHLGERDCSLQRNHQKVMEEAHGPKITPKEREKIGNIVTKAMRKIGYSNAGTVEFLYEKGEFYFIEMNTRLQVEHPVTEMVYGLDLVRNQIRIAAGQKLGFTQENLRPKGHAIECRINAEDPETFTPSPGLIKNYHAPGGLGVRVDSAIFSGYTVPPTYDSMIAKLIVHAHTREDCIQRLKRALDEFVIDGVKTTIPLQQKLLEQKDVINGDYDIHWLHKFMAKQKK